MAVGSWAVVKISAVPRYAERAMRDGSETPDPREDRSQWESLRLSAIAASAHALP
jgi:hypothetical protein